jgi:hypothetical protein
VTQTIRPPTRGPVSISSASLRCSRPLCSSQNTGGTPSTQEPKLPHGPRSITTTPRRVRKVQRPDRLTSMTDQPARSLRTQQRAQDHSPPSDCFRTRKGCTEVKTASPGQCQCSTHERQQGTFAPELTYGADKRCIQTLSPSAP